MLTTARFTSGLTLFTFLSQFAKFIIGFRKCRDAAFTIELGAMEEIRPYAAQFNLESKFPIIFPIQADINSISAAE